VARLRFGSSSLLYPVDWWKKQQFEFFTKCFLFAQCVVIVVETDANAIAIGVIINSGQDRLSEWGFETDTSLGPDDPEWSSVGVYDSAQFVTESGIQDFSGQMPGMNWNHHFGCEKLV
jgi:hypothetical protein